MLNFKMIVVLILVYSNIAFSTNVEKLLNEFNHKNDLSQKTIDENKGHLVLFSRDKLERMHAKTLKDVFKTTPVIYYHENRYGLTDPLTSGAFEAYRSNFIRLYIDGVEITQGWLGSGVVLYGDMNIDFVDHIEFYYMIPSFDTSVEPAYMTIFIYSKNSKRDNGGKLSLQQGSRGYNTQSLQYGESKEDYSYMINISHTKAKREKIDNGTDRPLSRDFERTQLFSYIKTDNQFFHLQVMKKNTDSLAGLSLDATPLVSQVDYLNLHMDYGISFNEYWSAQISYENLKTDIKEEDDNLLIFPGISSSNKFYALVKNSTYSTELTYKNNIGKHRIATGIKGRMKEFDSFNIRGIGDIPLSFTNETIISAFFQDQYVLSDLELLTLGIEYSYIFRNSTVENDELLQLRLGYIYTNEKWSYKAYLYRTMFALDPFSRYSVIDNFDNVSPQTTIGVTQEVSYLEEDYRLRLMLLMMKDEDGLVQNMGSGKTKYFFSVLDYDYIFDLNNKMNLQFYYAYYKDIFNVKKLEDMSGYFSFFNSYKKLDFYNGVVWHKNSINNINYFDYTSTITWNIDEDMTLSLKGENIFDRAKESSMIRISPTTGNMIAPLSITPIDQRIIVELEYTF